MLALNAVTLYIHPPPKQLRLMLARLHTIHSDPENGNEDLTAIVRGFRPCIEHLHQLFRTFLGLPFAVDYPVGIPIFVLHRVTHAIFILVTIEKAINATVVDKRQFIGVEETKAQLYLDHVVSFLRYITARCPNRSVVGFVSLLTVLQNWMSQQSTGVCGSQSPVTSRSHESCQRPQAGNVSPGQASPHPPNPAPSLTSGKSQGDDSESYADGGSAIMRSDLSSALRAVLAEDDIAMEHLGGFLELAENSVSGQEEHEW